MSNGTKRFREIVEEISREIVHALHRNDSSYIRTPLLYPSGANVVVRVEPGHPKFFVSDYGLGYDEADMMGGSNIFGRVSRPIAKKAGVSFDNRSFFAIQVKRDQLAGAVVAIANCSLDAVATVAHRIAERRQVADRERLYDRLEHVFSPKVITRQASILGASNTEWQIDALVTIDRRVAAFESVTAHHNSVASATTKFLDLSKLPKPPSRIAVVKRKQDLKTFLGVLSQAANVIEVGATDKTIREVSSKAA